jgi:catechol 2,3-dioxygenase-like lactoylglutathione lyase family enzyme
MESVIAKMVQDFEAGRVNRRELIQGIAAVAMAIAAPGRASAEQAPVNAPPANLANQAPMKFKAVSVDHISYQVTDYAKTRDFYVDLLGMDVSDDDGRSQCYLHFGDHGSFLLPRNRGGGRRAGAGAAGATSAAGAAGAAGASSAAGAAGATAAPPAAPPQSSVTSNVDHISYKIAEWNTDRVQAELERRGIKPAGRGGFVPDTGGANGPKNYASFHVLDPDGFNLQISGDLKPGDRLWKG